MTAQCWEEWRQEDPCQAGKRVGTTCLLKAEAGILDFGLQHKVPKPFSNSYWLYHSSWGVPSLAWLQPDWAETFTVLPVLVAIGYAFAGLGYGTCHFGLYPVYSSRTRKKLLASYLIVHLAVFKSIPMVLAGPWIKPLEMTGAQQIKGTFPSCAKLRPLLRVL